MNELLCPKCRRRIVLPAFSTGICKRCGISLVCANTPPDVLCSECAKKNNLCMHCGAALKENKNDKS